MNRFILDGRYGDLLGFYGISVEEALQKAGLPGDVFSHKTPAMKEEEYFKFMEAVGSLIPDPEMPVYLAYTGKIEVFSPPVFASYCSKNGRMCIERLVRYKKLTGPMVFLVRRGRGSTEVELTTETGENEPPQFLVETEILFLVSIIRKASNENIVPLLVKMKQPVSGEAFEEFIGVSVAQADFNSITFQNEDLEKPFISYDEAMWDYFEPELSRRLAQLDVDDSASARVRSAFDRTDAGRLIHMTYKR